VVTPLQPQNVQHAASCTKALSLAPLLARLPIVSFLCIGKPCGPPYRMCFRLSVVASYSRPYNEGGRLLQQQRSSIAALSLCFK
jgi:hypothetical protein